MNGDPANFDLAGFEARLGEAQAALRGFAEGDARRAADDVAVSFERAGARIARALGGASASGEVSFKRLAKSVLEEFAKLALDRVLGGGAFFGARAAGGAVTAGGAYLVGERGPELFTPQSAGSIGPVSGSISVHFHLGAGADGESIRHHQGQIAAQLARAVAYGRRNL